MCQAWCGLSAWGLMAIGSTAGTSSDEALRLSCSTAELGGRMVLKQKGGVVATEWDSGHQT